MVNANLVHIPGLTVPSDYSAYQYHLVKGGTKPDVAIVSGAGDIPVGVQYDKPTADGDPVDVVAFTPGSIITVITGSAGVTANSWVGTDASGHLVTKVANNDFVIGRVLKAWDSGDYAEVLCCPCYYGA